MIKDDDARKLIARIIDGDPSAFRALYDLTISDVSKTVGFLLDNPNGRDDVIQEVYVSLYRALRQYNPSKAFRPWLMGIVLRQVSSYRRSHWRFQRIKQKSVESSAPPMERDFSVDVTDKIFNEKLLRAVLGLTPKLRAVLVLRYLHDYTREEIAEALNIPVGTVNSRLTRAIQALREKNFSIATEGGVAEYEF
ncbi:sigma-70 family RNA polymerase sigma factor [Alicyclobacillus tolerans]|uniref:sigma-70 family RNA polymerase sigma factor n=1 Tax=Alicyclobacillus tolerans TaxID=90970 RepID=UPI001F0195A0|nr:sigma-70 family RNA polymerase sigma factor [Alicyclobacillus tolerans]MCF8568132.1 sigma-70 family RNA polymerase sigma factor [Alicyclobacillus tolerans]